MGHRQNLFNFFGQVLDRIWTGIDWFWTGSKKHGFGQVLDRFWTGFDQNLDPFLRIGQVLTGYRFSGGLYSLKKRRSGICSHVGTRKWKTKKHSRINVIKVAIVIYLFLKY